MLRDRIVCGVLDEALQRRLLAEPKLTFKDAEERALAAETATSNARILNPEQTDTAQTADVHQTSTKGKQTETQNHPCFRCGGVHDPRTCKFNSAVRHYCKKRGHIARVCLKKAKDGSESLGTGAQSTQHAHIVTQREEQEYEIYTMGRQVIAAKRLPYQTTVILNNKAHVMEVDFGAACSLISENTYNTLWSDQPPLIHKDNSVLKQWSQAELRVRGKIFAKVQYQGHEVTLPLLIVQGQGTSLLGRDWFDALGISMMGVHQVHIQSVESILNEYAEVFQELGATHTPPISIDIDPTASPKFFKACPVPFALRPKLDEELDKLVAQGIFEPVRTSRLAGGVIFSKLDLKQAYQQLVLDDAAAELLTINTHCGLFQARRLQFGVSTAVSIFQRFMDTLLAGIPEAGLRLQKEKSIFAASQVEFLGFRVDKDGVRPTSEKVEAIQKVPSPQNKTQLQSFLGLLNFYSCFLPNKATVLEALHRLLDQSSTWHWNDEHEKAYTVAKQLLQADGVLTHYDESKPLAIACDASPYGLGALLFHIEPDGREAPICFASRTLSLTERNYAQIDKEALAVIFAIRKFHQYLAGCHFVFFTDHKPLLGLLQHSKPMPSVLSPRMLRWSVILGAYDYELCYRPGKQLANADALSCLPLPSTVAVTPPPLEVLLLEMVPDAPLYASRIAALTLKDPILSHVLRWVLHGWPAKVPDARFKPFLNCRHELSAHKDCLLWGSRVVVPNLAREGVLAMLHDAHPGIVRMKGLGRSYVWWPGMDAAIEQTVKSCDICQRSCHAPPTAQLHPWEWTTKKWSRLHIDFAGPFQGKTFLIVVDSHSKWLEVAMVSSMLSSAVISTLRLLFATHGLPDVIVPDNGASFTSEAFKEFARRNGIRHVTTVPYHPRSNGQAERMVQTTKEALSRITAGDWQTCLARFLLSQHTTPNWSTGKSPAEMLMNRCLTTALNRLHPDFEKDMHHKQEVVADRQRGSARSFQPQDNVYMRSYVGAHKWVTGVIMDTTGPVSYRVQTPDGQLHRRHVDQLRGRVPACADPGSEESPDHSAQEPIEPTQPVSPQPPDSVEPGERSSPQQCRGEALASVLASWGAWALPGSVPCNGGGGRRQIPYAPETIPNQAGTYRILMLLKPPFPHQQAQEELLS
ncbi:uncharacterized protein K02A2.6-like [Neoarius graeffei]|uniref:uncharacterized protein K02A2.6-like n=1 Tax=Neoarius graeffei TaxID=443677 RepID=UPI00298CB29D|nr:uncharacterized protein K02A2.6-like [Neoarius graeffei]